jgi:hypothetical protein
MSSIDQKIPFEASINNFAQRKINNAFQSAGQSWPCTVVNVKGSIVTVTFNIYDPNHPDVTIPPVTCPVFGPEYIRYPIQVGDQGVCFSATASLKQVSGLGTGVATFTNMGNLSALVFFPVGNSTWTPVDPDALVLYGPNGVVIRDTESKTTITLTPEGIEIVRGNTNISIDNSSVNITADLITLNGAIELNGHISQTDHGHGTTANFIGPINVTNDVTAEGKSLATHEHTVNNVQGGTGSIITTEPN